MEVDNKLLWSAQDIANACSVCKRQVGYYRKHPNFPAPIRLPGPKATSHPRWRPEDIRVFIDLLGK